MGEKQNKWSRRLLLCLIVVIFAHYVEIMKYHVERFLGFHSSNTLSDSIHDHKLPSSYQNTPGNPNIITQNKPNMIKNDLIAETKRANVETIEETEMFITTDRSQLQNIDEVINLHELTRNDDNHNLQSQVSAANLKLQKLPRDYNSNENINTDKVIDSTVCIDIFKMDLDSLKIKVSLMKHEPSPFHCLFGASVMTDLLPTGHSMSMIRGHETWLSKLLNPSLPSNSRVVLNSDILKSMEHPMIKVAEFLLSNEIDVMYQDINGNSFLHVAASLGMIKVVKYIFSSLIDNFNFPLSRINSLVALLNKQRRSALHYAAINGHIEMMKLLIDYGGNLGSRDSFNISVIDILQQSGSAISQEDAMMYFNVVQQPIKKLLDRKGKSIHYSHGSWKKERLTHYEDDYSCDIDQYDFTEINSEMLFTKYIATNTPVLIRGVFDILW